MQPLFLSPTKRPIKFNLFNKHIGSAVIQQSKNHSIDFGLRPQIIQKTAMWVKFTAITLLSKRGQC